MSKFVESSLIHLKNNFNSSKSDLNSKIVIYAKIYVCSSNMFRHLNCLNYSILENHKLNLVFLICM